MPETKKSEPEAEKPGAPTKSDAPKPAHAAGIAEVLPQKPIGKEETRLYQTHPHKHEWLTKSEALEHGLAWAD